jgi:S1/P1 Nuclease
VGHATVAYIAEDHLTPHAKRAVRALLAPDTMAWVSSWADDMVQQRPETADWHHIDLDVRKNLTVADIPDYCVHGDCVVGQIELDLAILKNPKDSPDKKQEALKFLIHFVGDLHQPLHCANDDDRGGNEKYLVLSRSYHRVHWVRLHSYWDHLLEEKAREVPRDLATRLERRISPQDLAQWQKGNAADWAFESYLIAKNDIYSELPEGPARSGWDAPDLPEDYRRGAMRFIVDRQLEKAGIRLAWLLNQVFQ